MVSSKQRQRQLARAKWERQQSRRMSHAQRTRRFQVVAGSILGLIAAAALVWVVVWVVQQEDERTPDVVVPTDGERPSFISPPAETDAPPESATTPAVPTQTQDGTGQPNTTAPNTAGGTASSPPQGAP